MLCYDNYFLGFHNDQHVLISALSLLCLYRSAVFLGKKQCTIALLCHCPVPILLYITSV